MSYIFKIKNKNYIFKAIINFICHFLPRYPLLNAMAILIYTIILSIQGDD